MTTQALAIVHNYIRRFITIKGCHPTAEHLAIKFTQPVREMRAALASYQEART